MRRVVSSLILLVAASLALLTAHCETSGTLPRTTDGGAGGADGGGGADAGPTFCSSLAATFCADFDRAATPGAGFDGVDTAGGATLELVDATATSLPKCLRSSLPNLVANELHAKAELERKVALDGKRSLSLDLAMRVAPGTPAADEILRVLAVEIDGGSIGLFRSAPGWFLGIHRDNAGTDEDEEPALAKPIAEGTWTRVHLEIAFGRAPTLGRVRLTVDGEERLAKTLATHGDAQPLHDGALILGLARAAGAVSAESVDIDDVVLQLAE